MAVHIVKKNNKKLAIFLASSLSQIILICFALFNNDERAQS